MLEVMASSFEPKDLPTTQLIEEAALIVADVKSYEESRDRINAQFDPDSYFIPDMLKRICK